MLSPRSPGKENGFRPNLRRPRDDAVHEFPKGCGRGVRSVQPTTECEESYGDRNTLTRENVRQPSHRVDAVQEFPKGYGCGVRSVQPTEYEEGYGDGNTLTRKKVRLPSHRVDHVRGGCGKVGSYLEDAKGKHLAVPFSKDKEGEKLCVADVVDKARIRVNKVLAAYQEAMTEMGGHCDPKYPKLKGWDLYSQAATYIKRKWLNTEKRTGHIPGVEVGDKFRYRPELTIVGLHGHFQSGIDFMKRKNGIIATSVVDSGRYANKAKSTDVLIYMGHGGNPEVKGEVKDQKAVGGNLALMNSIAERNPVRVIRKYKDSRNEAGYVYDGLYTVDDCHQTRWKFGKLVYKFTLTRIPGQPKLTLSGRLDGDAKNPR